MKFYVITAFPDFFTTPLQTSLLGKAIKSKKLEIEYIYLRDYAVNKHGQIDDVPYGGDHGMLFMIEPIDKAIQFIKKKEKNIYVISFTPRGTLLKQQRIQSLYKMFAEKEIAIVLICGRYEGIDHRVEQYLVDENISIGSVIVSGGEVCSLIFIEAIARFIPGFMGNPKSLQEDSFSLDNQIEYPQYTKPETYKTMSVPKVLLSGNHQEIKKWKEAKFNYLEDAHKL